MLSQFVVAIAFLSGSPLPPDRPPTDLLRIPGPLAHPVRYANDAIGFTGIVDVSEAGATAQEQAHTYLTAQLGQDIELLPTLIDHTSRGDVVHFRQGIHGVPVEGTFAMAVIDRAVVHYAAARVINPAELSTTPRIDAAAAVTIATTNFAPQEVVGVHAPRLVVAYDGKGVPALAWRVPLRTVSPASDWAVYIDAQNGSMLGFKQLGQDKLKLVGEAN